MNSKTFLFRFIFLAAALCGVISAQAKTVTQTNSKGFSIAKFSGDSCGPDGHSPSGVKHPVGFTQQGNASFYGGYWDGRKTANGEIYNQMSMTAAHKSLPFNCEVCVRNLLNNKEVVVRINNRGPFVKGRIIDLSVAAANKLEMRSAGIVPVEIRVIE